MSEPEDIPRVNYPQTKFSPKYYAGRYTPELEKKHFTWCSQSKRRDTFCIICLGSFDFSGNDFKCNTCPRAYHFTCISMPSCPLCFKRLWDVEPPFKPNPRAFGSKDQILVKQWRRHTNWDERIKRKDFFRWATLYDDGSLLSDRLLLYSMEIASYNSFRGFNALEQANGGTDAFYYWTASHNIKLYENELELRQRQLEDVKSRWAGDLRHPYVMTLEDANGVLRAVIEQERSGDSGLPLNLPHSSTARLKEAEDQIRQLEESLAHASTAIFNNAKNSKTESRDSSATVAPSQADDDGRVSLDTIAKVMLAYLKPPEGATRLTDFFMVAGLSWNQVDRLMQLDIFPELLQNHNEKQERERYAQQQPRPELPSKPIPPRSVFGPSRGNPLPAASAKKRGNPFLESEEEDGQPGKKQCTG